MKIITDLQENAGDKIGRHSRAGANHEVLSEANLKANCITIPNQVGNDDSLKPVTLTSLFF